MHTSSFSKIRDWESFNYVIYSLCINLYSVRLVDCESVYYVISSLWAYLYLSLSEYVYYVIFSIWAYLYE